MNPKFIEHIHLDIPKPLTPKIDDFGNMTVNIANRFIVKQMDRIDNEITKQIVAMARSEGIDDIYLLDKKNIVSALEKQIPKKPLKKSIEWNGEYGYCPCCNKVIAYYDSDKVCRQCGQTLDWSDTNDR